MGTHPIFESDFDCLTEMQARNLIKRVNPCRIVPQRQMRSEPWQGESLIEIGTRTIFAEEHSLFFPFVHFCHGHVLIKKLSDRFTEHIMLFRENGSGTDFDQTFSLPWLRSHLTLWYDPTRIHSFYQIPS